MHSRLLEGLECEFQTENNGRIRSRGTLLGLQHFKRVEGHAEATKMGLGRVDKLHSLTRTCTKPTQSG
jgi:hypothetical protein